jgi:transcriptional regulator with XRE-family HTH domain
LVELKKKGAKKMLLRPARLLAGFSQNEVASELGVHQQTYSQIERGLRLATKDERKRLSEILEVPIDELEFPDELALRIRTRVG